MSYSNRSESFSDKAYTAAKFYMTKFAMSRLEGADYVEPFTTEPSKLLKFYPSMYALFYER